MISTDYTSTLNEYRDFLRLHSAMMRNISNTLEGVNKELVFSEELTDSERKELEAMQDKLEEIYDGLDAVIREY
ncbi:MAG: hypothetical protein II877_04280 [Synergistaceae bacterium]|nr:hypothetical protein [Synergistaceae bacterium]MBQ4430699.1 hypothetical protein [Synergistaceae bacterium]MBQ6666145.1 hypothetical protein [Synergistaceae bacterium]